MKGFRVGHLTVLLLGMSATGTAGRRNVIKFGTTLDPEFVRQDGKSTLNFPDRYTYRSFEQRKSMVLPISFLLFHNSGASKSVIQPSKTEKKLSDLLVVRRLN